MTLKLFFILIAFSVLAFEDDIEIIIDEDMNVTSGQEMLVSLDDFLAMSTKDMRDERIKTNLNKLMVFYHHPMDYELAIRIMFFTSLLTVGHGAFSLASDEKIELLEHLIAERRINPDVLLSRCDEGTLFMLKVYGRFETDRSGRKSVSVYEWLTSQCAQSVRPFPAEANEDEEKWYDLLKKMRDVCLFRRDWVEAYETLRKIEESAVITYDEKAAMRHLYEQTFRKNSMMIFFL